MVNERPAFLKEQLFILKHTHPQLQIHTHTHTHTHERTHTHTHARTQVRTHARTHAYTHARTHARTHTHTHTHIFFLPYLHVNEPLIEDDCWTYRINRNERFRGITDCMLLSMLTVNELFAGTSNSRQICIVFVH